KLTSLPPCSFTTYVAPSTRTTSPETRWLPFVAACSAFIAFCPGGTSHGPPLAPFVSSTADATLPICGIVNSPSNKIPPDNNPATFEVIICLLVKCMTFLGPVIEMSGTSDGLTPYEHFFAWASHLDHRRSTPLWSIIGSSLSRTN